MLDQIVERAMAAESRLPASYVGANAAVCGLLRGRLGNLADAMHRSRTRRAGWCWSTDRRCNDLHRAAPTTVRRPS